MPFQSVSSFGLAGWRSLTAVKAVLRDGYEASLSVELELPALTALS
jgi:hypothetical protein